MNNAVLIDIAFITVISNILYQINVGLVNRRYLFKNIAVQKPLIGRLYILQKYYIVTLNVCVCVCVCVCVLQLYITCITLMSPSLLK